MTEEHTMTPAEAAALSDDASKPLPTIPVRSLPPKPLIVEIDVSVGPESPCANDGWKLHSFAKNKFITDVDPDEYVKKYDPATGEVTPANIGLRRRLDTGLAFWLSYQEHGDGHWSLKGGPVDRWDGTRLAGILVWEGKLKYAPEADKRAADAEKFVENYNEWANGYVYDWSVREPGKEDPTDSGSEWIGTDHMMKRIVELVGDRPVIARGDCDWMLTNRDNLYTGKKLAIVDEEELLEDLLDDEDEE